MMNELIAVKENESIEDMRKRFGNFLGLSDIPVNALLRALKDQSFAQDLIVCRNSKDFLNALLSDPRNEEYGTKGKQKELSNKDLLKKVGKAFINWGKAGFTVVDELTLEKRENACLGCENLGKPKKTLQRLVTSKSKDRIGQRAADCVCNLCGCSISKKIRLPSESCPAKDPANSALNRWGEPYRQPEQTEVS